MTILSRNAVLQQCGFTTAQAVLIFRELLAYPDVPDSQHRLDTTEALIVWVADLVYKVKFLEPEERLLLLRTLAGQLRLQSTAIMQDAVRPAGTPAKHTCMLVFADRRYVAFTGIVGYINVENGEQLSGLPRPALETVAYNVSEWFRRKLVQALKSSDAPTPQQ